MVVLKLIGTALALSLTMFSCIASAESSSMAAPVHESAKQPALHTRVQTLGSISVLVPQKKLKSTPTKVEIYQYDNAPLAGRKPLLLVHGLVGEFHPLFRWKELTEYLSWNQDFQRNYKIYMARFDSSASMKTVTASFNLALRDLDPSDKTTIIAISLSGAIIRNAMKDPEVARSISRVITMGTPFRGSPLFCMEWMNQSIRKRHLSPFYRIHRPLGLKVYFAHHKNILQDHVWDNVDRQMPIADRSSKEKQEFISAPYSSVRPSKDFASEQEVDKKFIVYAGYLHNRYIPRHHGGIQTFVTSPFAFLRTTLLAHLRNEHAALRLLNYLIADAVPRDGSKKIIYPINDGISPISSSLLLSNDFVANSELRNLDELAKIRTKSYAKKARLFENADHLTFIEERRATGSPDVKDVLSLDEKPRPMFDWILADLLE